MIVPRALACLVCAAVVAAAATLAGAVHVGGTEAEQAPDRGFTLAVLRTDGIMLPFAAYDGSRWSTPWPTAVGNAPDAISEIPPNLDAVPAKWWGRQRPAEWRLWPGGGDAAIPVRLIAPAVLPVGRVGRLGIRTDYRVNFNPLIPTVEFPYPKEGLVVGGDARVTAVATVSRQIPAWGEMAARLRPDIDAVEESAIRALRANARWTHPYDKGARGRLRPELEAWYSSRLAEEGHVASYIEAVKKYPPTPADEGCGLETFVRGWVQQATGETRLKTALKAVITYCDREKVSYMLPFGQMRIDDRTHWIYQMSGQDHEWYAVAELTPGRTRVRAEYHAGLIPSPAQ
jgi:hypothetical protein